MFSGSGDAWCRPGAGDAAAARGWGTGIWSYIYILHVTDGRTPASTYKDKSNVVWESPTCGTPRTRAPPPGGCSEPSGGLCPPGGCAALSGGLCPVSGTSIRPQCWCSWGHWPWREAGGRGLRPRGESREAALEAGLAGSLGPPVYAGRILRGSGARGDPEIKAGLLLFVLLYLLL